MTVHPKNQKDLMLAPVAVEIDRNLERMRDREPLDVEAELELELDRPAMCAGREERAELVLRQALRNVDMHGWSAAITSDGARLHLEGARCRSTSASASASWVISRTACRAERPTARPAAVPAIETERHPSDASHRRIPRRRTRCA